MMIRTRIFEGSDLYYRMVIDCGENQLHVMVHKCWSKDRRYLCYGIQLYNGHTFSDIILRNYTTKSMIQFKLPCWHYILFFSPLWVYFLCKATCITLQARHHITASVKINNCTASLQFVIFFSSINYICRSYSLQNRIIQFTFTIIDHFFSIKAACYNPLCCPYILVY